MQIFSSIQDDGLVRALLNGGVGILPTDTIYGIVARAEDMAAVEKMQHVKHREQKAGTVIAASVEQLYRLGLPRRPVEVASRWWPGAVSVRIATSDELDYLAETGTVAVRIPDSESLQQLLAQTGPLITSSANRPGEPHATTLAEAQDAFGDTVDFYVDGGTIADAIPSTVIQVTEGGHIEVVRQGAVQIT